MDIAVQTITQTEEIDVAEKKPQKLKARLPRGLADRGPGEIAATRRMIETISKQFELYGFDPVETPAIEYTDALGKFLPDQDRPNEGVFSFQDDDEQWLSLRYDLTAPLARYVAENFHNIALPYRSYRYGWVFRNEKPGPGRYRQFMQFDADTVGSASPAADAEMCMLAADTMEALGIPRGSYVVKVNNRKVLDGVMESIGLGGDENAGKRLTVLRAIDKLDRLEAEGVRQLLGEGRKDESGDFTKGAGLTSEQIEKILIFASLQSGAVTELEDVTNLPPEQRAERSDVSTFSETGKRSFFVESNKGVIDGMMTHFGGNPISRTGIDELNRISGFLEAAGYQRDRIRIDPSVVRGLEYYTGPVYEVELLLDTKDEKGRPVRFGSVGGGGRYDGLVSRFRGEPVPATGFSIGVSRLMAALTLLKKIESKPEPGPVLVTVFDQSRVADYQRMVQTLRKEGIRAEMYLGSKNHGIGQQLKYADKRGAPCAIIQGGDEKAKGEVQIKNLILGAEIAGLSKEREDYLKQQAQAQFAVKEEKLVEAVRELLARHGIQHG
ncbi:MAG: histidyl-tRNA synthetase [Alphaproteobacteria bacterium]|jgi:histidyl-tRNA synthetase|nr:histidyl-tRNA synthetase [Alphaproteobacteria bacterium]